MNLLKKENWWTWILITIFTGGASIITLGALLDVYKKNAWYANYKYWLIGLLCFIFPISFMASIFIIQSLCLVSAKLEIPGKDLYLSPYIWILAIIIPFIGWIYIITMIIYMQIWIIIYLAKGKGEKFIK